MRWRVSVARLEPHGRCTQESQATRGWVVGVASLCPHPRADERLVSAADRSFRTARAGPHPRIVTGGGQTGVRPLCPQRL